ncbi:MAG TPA: NYN domain-containing protein [Gemmatimonadales bacterium]|nr:NYN domain-containing protein [Gemmatimonadales bacterium]
MTYPHLRPGRMAELSLHAPNAALLIDFDNVTLGIRSDLTKELRTLLNSDIIKGKVAVQRAYADWRRYPQYIVPLSESSIDLIFAPAFGTSKKNATDIRLAIDAIELVFTRPEIGTFIIMSGDSDFSTMVIKLKEYGKYVIGVGIRESASDLLIQNCDEYYSYSDLAGLSREGETPSIQRDPWELVTEAIQQMARNGDVMRSDRLKQVMQQIDTNFDERNAGFNRFSKFVVEAGAKGLLQVSKLENGQYEVAPPSARAPRGAEAARAAEPAAPRREERREDGRRGRGRGRGRGREREEGAREAAPAAAKAARPEGTLSLARAFQLMTEALGQLGGAVSSEQLRGRMAAMHGREDPLLETSRFARLLRQANDAEVADVRKLGEDEYEISLHRGRATPQVSPQPKAAPVVEAPAANGAAASAPAVPAAEPAAATYRPGLRFRRGSRAPMRTGEIPLVGVVSMEPIAPAEPAPAAEAPARAAEPRPSRSRKPAAPRGAKRTRTRAATEPAAESPAPKAAAKDDAKPARKRARPRARKAEKAE